MDTELLIPRLPNEHGVYVITSLPAPAFTPTAFPRV